jgi:hypothetical protein
MDEAIPAIDRLDGVAASSTVSRGRSRASAGGNDMESMLEHAATSATVPTEAEAYQTLLARAHRKTGAVAPELVVRHILSVTGAADWPVRREALEALPRNERKPRWSPCRVP